MSRSASDRLVCRWAGGVVLAGAVLLAAAPDAFAQSTEQAGESAIVSSEIAVSRQEAALRLGLADGRTVKLAIRDGEATLDDAVLGPAPRGGELDRSWRSLLNEAIHAPTVELAGLLNGWEPPAGDVAAKLDEALETSVGGGMVARALPDDEAEADVEAASDSVSRLVDRVTELQRLVDDLEDQASNHAVVRVDRGSSWTRPLRHIFNGLAGILSILVTYAVIFAIGFATIFFGGRRYIEGVADTARRATMRSLLVGLAASFLIIPAFILGIIALAISIVGIPGLFLWIPLFPVATGLALLLGYLAVAHATGEALAERRFYGTDWFKRGNSYYFIMSGLAVLMALFIAGQVVSMAGSLLGFFSGALMALGAVVTWASLSIGLGAVLISRGGTRPVSASGMAEPDMYAEETRV